jgi:23S rRNA (guanosine2251-2'-O)-methyltransferase
LRTRKRIQSEKSENKYDLIWGRQPVLEALQSQLPLELINLYEDARGTIIDKIQQKAEEKGIPVQKIKRARLEDEAAGQNHQGIVAYMAPYAYLSVEELLENVRREGKYPFLLMLDHLQDPHNLGALIRTAAAAGVHGLILPRDRACGVTPAVFKSSAGALAHVPVARAVNLARETDFLKKQGLWFMGADMSGEQPFYEADFNLPLVLVLGNEGGGLSRLIREKCDFLLHIPMREAISSLNVAVAGGIICYEVFRQRSLSMGY